MNKQTITILIVENDPITEFNEFNHYVEYVTKKLSGFVNGSIEVCEEVGLEDGPVSYELLLKIGINEEDFEFGLSKIINEIDQAGFSIIQVFERSF